MGNVFAVVKTRRRKVLQEASEKKMDFRLLNFSYNEIHNRRVALGITCVQCTPVQLEILRRAGAMPISSRRCGMITKREAERLCKSFLGENRPPKLPDNFAFDVSHECAWGCRGSFIPARYNSSRAKCIKCSYCSMYFSPNKFIFHSHRTPDAKYTQPDAANFNSWRRHLKLTDKSPQDELVFAWEDVKAMFNGGSRKRALPPPPAAAAAAPSCHPLGAVKAAAAAAVVGGGLLSPHLLAAPPELHQKRPRFEEDEELPEAAHGAKSPRSYPVIPVPSKGSFGGVLQKFPACGGLFPHPYGFPAAAFGLCHKKEEGGEALGAAHKGGGGGGGGGLSGLFWPGRKDAAFYPPFCMFWPPRTPGGLPVPTYLEEEEGERPPRGADPLTAGGRFPLGRGAADKGGRDRPTTGPFPAARPPPEERPGEGQAPLPPKAGSGGGSPTHHPAPEEQPPYKDNQKSKESNQVILPTKEDNFSDKNKEHNFFITDSEPSGGDFWRDIAGEHTQETNSPHSLKKDVENMGKEELQKVLFEQIDLRRRLEQEFQVLKGNTSFPVFNNFQDQMKRELAYREEMVQQLQIIPYAASLIRKEKLGAHLSKS
nr:SKI family transcriptional corepressor 2 [Dromaius novaehollandiae]